MTIPLCQVGDRIRLLSMGDDPCPVPDGTTGTITGLHLFRDDVYVSVNWDNGRTLNLVCPPDVFEVLP